MGQRLGIASALLGNPQTIVLDEPINGLDPEGILWVRNLLKALAAEGRTVFISSHLMGEMALTAHHLIVIGRGELIADLDMEEFIALASTNVVLVWTPDAATCATCSSARTSPSPVKKRGCWKSAGSAPKRSATWPSTTTFDCTASATSKPPSKRRSWK